MNLVPEAVFDRSGSMSAMILELDAWCTLDQRSIVIGPYIDVGSD